MFLDKKRDNVSLNFCVTGLPHEQLIYELPISIAVFDRQMHFLAYSRKWLEAFQLDENTDYSGRSLHECISDVPPVCREVHRRAVAGEFLFGKADLFPKTDGTLRYIDWEAKPWHDAGGTVGGAVITIQDVTETVERNRMFERINALQKRFVAMFENHEAMMFLIAPENGAIIDANKSAQAFYGYSHAEFCRMNVSELNTLLSEEIARLSRDALENRRNYFVFEHRLKNGDVRIVEVHSSPIEADKGTLLFSIVRDITRERENERRLSQTMEQFNRAKKIAKLGIWEYDLDRDELKWSDEVYEIFDLDKDETKPSYTAFLALVHPDDRAAVDREYRESMRTKKRYRVTHRLKMKDGRVKYVQEECDTTYDGDGRALRSLGTIFDITRVRELASAVEGEKRRFQELMEHASDGIHILDVDGNLVAYSRSFAQMLGYGYEDAACLNVRNWDAAIPEAEMDAVLQKLITHAEPFETRHRREDGSIFDVQITAKGVELEGKTYLYASSRDITERKRLEKEVITERNFVSTIVDTANAVIAVILPDGTMSRINRYGETFVGYGAQEIASEPYFWKRFLNPAVSGKVTEIIAKARRGDMVTSFQNSWIARTGEERMFEWSNTLVKDENGGMAYIFTIGIDISEKVRAQELLRRQKESLEALTQRQNDLLALFDKGDAVLLQLKNGDAMAVEYVSENIVNLLGYTEREFLGGAIRYSSLIHPEDFRRYERELLNAAEGRSDFLKHEPYRIRTKQHEVKWLLDHTVVRRDAQGGIVHFVAYLIDVTRQKKAEAELIEAKEHAVRAANAKSQFLANISHEIRTPLSGIIGLTDLLLKTELSERQRAFLLKSKNASKALSYIINDILDYSKIEAGKLDFESHSFRIHDVLSDLRGLFEHPLNEKGIAFKITVDPATPEVVFGDSFRLAQVFNNLVSNALKFTERGSVELAVKTIYKDRSGVRLLCSVSDTGMGISEDVRARLFKVFSQSDSSNARKYGGTGLGLAISRQLVKRMKGRIWAESTEGEGTTFRFTATLELPDRDEAEKFGRTDSSRSLGELKVTGRVLLVDDHELNRLVARELLTMYGVEVTVATNGKEGVVCARDGRFDLIFMDLQMPVMDGYAACKLIRSFNADVPIVALSAAAMAHDRQLSFDAGMNEHVSKPIDIKDLKRLLKRYLKRA